MEPKYRIKLFAAIRARYKTLSEFSDKSGVGRGRLSEIVNGWRIPTQTEIQDMALALDLYVDDVERLVEE